MSNSFFSVTCTRRQLMAWAGSAALLGVGGRVFADVAMTQEAIDEVAGGKALKEGRID